MGETSRCRPGAWDRARQDCDESRHPADKLLIRPTRGRQPGTDPHARTDPRKDTPKTRVSQTQSHTREASMPDWTALRTEHSPTLTVRPRPSHGDMALA